MFDPSTLPDVKVVEESLDGFVVSKNGHHQILSKEIEGPDGEKEMKQLMCLSLKTLREYKEQYSSYDLAYGDVLMSGWGFGLAPCWIAGKPGVRSVTVIELNTQVVEIFKRNNTIPNNVKILYDDIKTYKTQDKYDCMFLDHFPDHDRSPVFNEVAQIVKNIPNHDVLWFWSLEQRYIMDAIGFANRDLWVAPKSMNDVDFESNWNSYIEKYSAKKIPKLNQEKLELYIKTYFNRLIPGKDFPKDMFPR